MNSLVGPQLGIAIVAALLAACSTYGWQAPTSSEDADASDVSLRLALVSLPAHIQASPSLIDDQLRHAIQSQGIAIDRDAPQTLRCQARDTSSSHGPSQWIIQIELACVMESPDEEASPTLEALGVASGPVLDGAIDSHDDTFRRAVDDAAQSLAHRLAQHLDAQHHSQTSPRP